jgi:Icc-related predicted phosphoesterase
MLPTIRPDVVLSCGDLPFDYLEYLVSRLDVPVLYVLGNHDPSLKMPDMTWMPLRSELPPLPGPQGCTNIDGRVVEVQGVRIAGLGGSLRYKEGPNQYSQGQMGRRALRLELLLRLKRVQRGRKLDLLVLHAPPYGAAEAKDAAHVGFVSFLRLIRNFRPVLAVHGHIHPYGRVLPERQIGSTRVVNVVPWRLLEI